MQRCVKISKQSMKKFRRFKILKKRTFTFLFIWKIDISISDHPVSPGSVGHFCCSAPGSHFAEICKKRKTILSKIKIAFNLYKSSILLFI